MQVSLSVSDGGSSLNAASHQRWTTTTGEFKNLAKVITSRVWSPSVFSDGRRRKTSFVSSQLICLDFDQGVSIEDAKGVFSNVAAMIGTTKSHQIEKVSASGAVLPPCDRFRAVLLTDTPQTNLAAYEHTLSVFTKLMGADVSCKDGARLFYPCKEIVWKNLEGGPMKWLEPDDALSQEEVFRIGYEKAKREMFIVPDWVQHVLIHGADEGERHVMCYRVGAELYKRGFTASQIFSMFELNDSPILRGIGPEDVRRAISNGKEKVDEEVGRYTGEPVRSEGQGSVKKKRGRARKKDSDAQALGRSSDDKAQGADSGDQ